MSGLPLAFHLLSIGNADSRENAVCNDIDHLVQRMLDLHKQLTAARTPSDQTPIQRQIDP